MPAMQISYSITRSDPHPSDPPASDSVSFPLDSSSPHAHLVSLETALGDARSTMNERLTEWKNVLKDVEKPPKKGKKQDDDEEVDDDDEEAEEDETSVTPVNSTQ